jgi:site-specific recombinase XerD
MAGCEVVRRSGAPAFAVTGADGIEIPAVSAFMRCLVARDRSAYTLLAYARALAHFLDWCADQDVALAAVTPISIEGYISGYRWSPDGERAASTINHRLSVLASFFDFLIESGELAPDYRDTTNKRNPVRPATAATLARPYPMRRLTGRIRGDFRRRLPKRAVVRLSSDEIERVYVSATNWRDRALLRLLEWSGQRIGDWDTVHGRHGLLGLRLEDIDMSAFTITVRLKGAREDHVVPVGGPFWIDYRTYLERERGQRPHTAVWIAHRKGGGEPLGYPTFETMIRVLRRRSAVTRLAAHAYRHTFAQNLLDSTDNLALVQAFLGHASPETTAAHYARVPMSRLVAAVEMLEERRGRPMPTGTAGSRYAFAYAPDTLITLEGLFRQDADD